MQSFIPRSIQEELHECISQFPCTAILGPRQCGKTSLARFIANQHASIYLDLERPADIRRLQEAELFFSEHHNKLICLDEIQRVPELFPILRSWIDRNRKSRFLILGSASRDLIRQGSETLAGRIAYLELTPFLLRELNNNHQNEIPMKKVWLKGGFPLSLLTTSDKASFRWRENFVQTFLERDIPALGINLPPRTLERLWSMTAHYHSQTINSSALGKSLNLSHTAIRKYIDILCATFMLRLLPPFSVNLKKRLIKSPKLYLRDSGLLHSLLGIESFNDLLGHPSFGASWEGFALEQVLNLFPNWKSGFYRTSDGTELDLILEKGNRRIGFEFKASTAPTVTKGFWNVLRTLNLKQTYVVAPVESSFPLAEDVRVIPLEEIGKII